MILEPIDFITGLFSLILVIVCVSVGVSILSKYRKYNNRIFITAGLASCGLYIGWYSSAISFVLFVITGSVLSPEIYFLIFITPTALVTLPVSYTHLTLPTTPYV